MPADHFSTGVWARDGPLRFRHYTCVLCGHRSVTWATFKRHRADCQAKPEEDEPEMTIHLLCLIIALLCFIAAALYAPPAPPRFNLIGAGLAFVALALIFP